MGMRFRVVQLDGPDSTDVIQPASQLRVARSVWKLRLGNELVGLVIQVVGKVVAQKKVENRGLQVVVVSQCGNALDCQKLARSVKCRVLGCRRP